MSEDANYTAWFDRTNPESGLIKCRAVYLYNGSQLVEEGSLDPST